MTGATVPWVPGSGVGRRPHRGRGPDALPANYLLLCVCITSSALVVRTLGLVHLRTGSSDRGYLSRGSLAVSQVLGTVRFLCVEFATDRQKRGSIFLLIRQPRSHDGCLFTSSPAVNSIQLSTGYLTCHADTRHAARGVFERFPRLGASFKSVF